MGGVYGSVTNNSGLHDWYHWQLLSLSLSITTNNRLRLAPFLTGLRVSSIVTDLDLVYELVTSPTNDSRITKDE
jgi:hypothetical protein